MDDRDNRRVRTPPMGVAAQTARPLAESWDGELTPLPQSTREAIAQVDRRVATSGIGTLAQVDLLRTEIKVDVNDVRSRVDSLVGHLAAISAQSAKIAGQVEILIADRDGDRREKSTIRTETVLTELEIRKTAQLAEVEVGRTRDLAEIEERKKSREHLRWLVVKLIAGIGVIWAAISTILLTK